MSAIVEVLRVLGEFIKLRVTMIQRRHARHIEEYQAEHYAFSEDVRQHGEEEGGEEQPSAPSPQREASPQSVRYDIHEKSLQDLLLLFHGTSCSFTAGCQGGKSAVGGDIINLA